MPVSAATPAKARWEALGTSVVLLVSEPRALARAWAIVERELNLIDRACSRFRPDSDLQRVNARAGHFVAVCPLLIEALQVALRAAELTDGDVDPTIGRALILAGYDRDWTQLSEQAAEPEPGPGPEPEPGREPGPQPRSRSDSGLGDAASATRRRPELRAQITPGWQAIEIDRARTAIRVPTGVRLDLGATAKAWVADRAAAAVHERTGAGSLVSLGGDIATAGAAPADGWRIYVTDDHRCAPDAHLCSPDLQGQTISIRSGGIATSSTAVRRWSHAGQSRHHLIDPATGASTAGPWRTVSVAAETCLDANIASTAALIRAARAPAWLEQLGLPARLVGDDGAVRLIGDWPEDDVGREVDGRGVDLKHLENDRPEQFAGYRSENDGVGGRPEPARSR